MNTKFFALLAGLTILAVGCVNTVTGKKTAGVPFLKDKIEARYERSLDEVFKAAKDVISSSGILVNEQTLHGQTNLLHNIAKIAEGKINQRTVWVRVEQVDRKVSAVTVQARTSGGGSDIDLAAEVDKRIALRLVR